MVSARSRRRFPTRHHGQITSMKTSRSGIAVFIGDSKIPALHKRPNAHLGDGEFRTTRKLTNYSLYGGQVQKNCYTTLDAYATHDHSFSNRPRFMGFGCDLRIRTRRVRPGI